MNLYMPILVLGAIAAAFAVGLGRDRACDRPEALQPGQARGLRVRHRADARPIAGLSRRPASVPGEVLPDRDVVHRLRHRDRVPLSVGGGLRRLGLFALGEMVLFMFTVFVAYAYVWRRGGLNWD